MLDRSRFDDPAQRIQIGDVVLGIGVAAWALTLWLGYLSLAGLQALWAG